MILTFRLFCFFLVFQTLFPQFEHAYAQDFSYVNYSTNNGMPSSQVYHIMQDSNGYIWFASDRGIAKFDGNEFELFDLTNGLLSITTFEFYPQKNGDIWCSSLENEWIIFRSNMDTIVHYEFNDTVVKYSKGGLNYDLVVEDNGTKHFSYENLLGVLSIDSNGYVLNEPKRVIEQGNYCLIQEVFGKEKLSYTMDYHSFAEMNKSYIKEAEIKKVVLPYYYGFKRNTNIGDTLIFSCGKNVIIRKNDTDIIRFNTASQIIGIGQFDENKIWIGMGRGGVKIFTLDGEEIAHYLKGKSVSYVFEDKHQGLWFSTLSNGVFYTNSNGIKNYRFKDNSIHKLYKGKHNGPIVANMIGEAYDFRKDHFDLIFRDQLSPKKIHIVYDKKEERYLIPYKGEKFVNQEIEEAFTIADCLYEEGIPTLYSGSWKFRIKEKNRIKAYTADVLIKRIGWADNGVFLGTGEGLYFFDTLTTEYSFIDSPELDYRITDIERKNGINYIGTLGNGVVRYDKGNIQKIETSNGLVSNLVNQLFVENDTTLWVATNKGLNRIVNQKGSLHIDLFDKGDGLPDNDINDVIVIDNVVWVATRSGLCSIDKNRIDQHEDKIALYLGWKDFKVKNETLILSSKNYEFNADENQLKFSFKAIYFGGRDDIQFRYKLDEHEDRWNYTQSRYIDYAQLSAGKYNLTLQASVTNSNWEDNALSLSFRIHPPFYKTVWFICFMILFSGCIIYWFFKVRVLIYNGDLVREMMRFVLKKIKPTDNSFVISEQGKKIIVLSNEVKYVKSARNYLEIVTENGKHVIRHKIGEFLDLVPDKIEYMRIHRSYIVRIDQIKGKGIKELIVGDESIPVGKNYREEIQKMEI